MKRFYHVWVLVSFIIIFPASLCPAGEISPFAKILDELAASYYEEQLQVAFGTFTYEYSELATPFSRWLEDELTHAVPSSKRVRLFNRAAAMAMDDTFRELYGEFFATNQVDALLSGRYFQERETVRVRLDLTSLRNGNLIGSTEFQLRKSELPSSVSIAPDPIAMSTAKNLSGILGATDKSPSSRQNPLTVSLSTSRGAGATYRNGENLVIMAVLNQDAYLRLYHVDVKGNTKLIWPNRFGGGDGRLRANMMVTIPNEQDPFHFRLGPPYGTEFIKAVASTEPFAHQETDFEPLGTDARGIITRGIGLTQKSGDARQRYAEALASYIILPEER